LRRLRSAIVIGVAAASLASVAVTAGSAGAQSTGNQKQIFIYGNFEAKGESTLAQPQFDDGLQMGVKDLEKQGWTVTYKRVPAGATSAAAAEQAFTASTAEHPDVIVGLTSSTVFVPVGPKVAATDQPTIALSAPSEGVKDGPSGGDNIFMIRPLNEQTYAKDLAYVCKDGKKALGLKGDVKIALNLVQGSFGSTVENTVKQNIGDYKGCSVVNTTTNAFNATDLTQQVLSIKDSGANVILSANYPAPSGVLVNQLRQNGVTIPFVGGASLNLAVDAGSIQSLDKLWASDDCVPELQGTKTANKFVKAYTDQYGYAPNYASAQTYDIAHIVANAITKAGSHDWTKINKALAGTDYAGVCDFKNDKNNDMAQSVTVYKYKGATDKTKVLAKKYPLDFIPNEELGVGTTLPPTTVKAG
jgi:branched-chain amino acid transport system substrate-binding protein